ncbi:hypothetical protein TNCV_4591741 [Trichonephila clavipes]|nr:hypothetical protein TNCV_4591741 [Trichonephila clavipes]
MFLNARSFFQNQYQQNGDTCGVLESGSSSNISGREAGSKLKSGLWPSQVAEGSLGKHNCKSYPDRNQCESNAVSEGAARRTSRIAQAIVADDMFECLHYVGLEQEQKSPVFKRTQGLC